jgi:uncharacterized membrane protein
MLRRRSQIIVLVGSGIWCWMIVAAPIFHLHLIYSFFSTICHQDPLRSWQIHGEPLAACVRCSSIYFGFFLSTLLLLRPNPTHLKIAVALSIGEFILARVLFDSPWLRGTTGLILGAAVAPFVLVGIREMSEMRFRRDAV